MQEFVLKTQSWLSPFVSSIIPYKKGVTNSEIPNILLIGLKV